MAKEAANRHQGSKGPNGRQRDAPSKAIANLPPCRMLLRSRDGVEVFTVSSERPESGSESEKDGALGTQASAETEARSFLLKGSTSFQVLHPDGKWCFVHVPDLGVIRLVLESEGAGAGGAAEPKAFLEGSSRVQVMEISPNGSYLLTWERPPPGDLPNLKVWSSETGECLAGFRQKSLRREAWPHIQWTSDESLAFLLCTNECRVYDGHFKSDLEPRFIDKMYISGLSSMSVGPSPARVLLATFSPNDSKKNQPSSACLYEYKRQENAEEKNSNKTHTLIMSKSMFQAEEMNVHWNPRGDSALFALQSSVDVSGQSYYGSTVLYLMSPPLPSAQGQRGKETGPVEVPLPQEGPVLDVAWMPNPSAKPQCFVVVAGRMPTMTSLHNGVTGQPTFVFGNAHRNTIAWAPHGRFVALAGFGNLAGGMTFWDRNKLRQIPSAAPCVASCTVGYGWSPDSRLFFSSTTSPRMNVDNGLKLFRYNGDPIGDVPWNNANYQPNKLLQASFIPKRASVYPDRPQSPSLRDVRQNASPAGVATEAPAPASGRYVPPSARNRTSGGGTSLADRMRAEKEGGMRGAQKVTGLGKISGKTTGPPGGTQVQKSIPGLAPAPPGQGKGKNARRGKQAKSEEKWAKMSLPEPPPEKETKLEPNSDDPNEEDPVNLVPVDPVKRERKIKKMLKQIEDLKGKSPESLNEDQKKKLGQEEELHKELLSLNVST